MGQKMCDKYIIEYYSAWKKDEILRNVKTWMNFKDSMLKWKKPVTKKTNHFMISLRGGT